MREGEEGMKWEKDTQEKKWSDRLTVSYEKKKRRETMVGVGREGKRQRIWGWRRTEEMRMNK